MPKLTKTEKIEESTLILIVPLIWCPLASVLYIRRADRLTNRMPFLQPWSEKCWRQCQRSPINFQEEQNICFEKHGKLVRLAWMYKVTLKIDTQMNKTHEQKCKHQFRLTMLHRDLRSSTWDDMQLISIKGIQTAALGSEQESQANLTPEARQTWKLMSMNLNEKNCQLSFNV